MKHLHFEEIGSENPQKMVIFLHGYGSNADDLISLAPIFAPYLDNTIFISPNAPEICEAGGEGFQWFSLREYNDGAIYRGLCRASPILDQFIDERLAYYGLKESNLIIIGFSQGTMMALHTMFRRNKACAGVIGFSGRLSGAEYLEEEIISKPNICLIHGTRDEVVSFDSLEMAKNTLDKLGINIQAYVIDGLGHGIDDRAIKYAIEFLEKIN